MFDQLFKSPRAVERHSTRPLLEERLRYLARCAGQGSTRSSLRQIAQHLLVFIDYLHLEAADEISVEQIHAAADRWVGRQPQPHQRDRLPVRENALHLRRQAMAQIPGPSAPG